MSGSGDGLVWRRSRRCSNGSCVEVAADPTWIHLRDSKDPHGGRLTFSHAEWRHFLSTIRSAGPDQPADEAAQRSAS